MIVACQWYAAFTSKPGALEHGALPAAGKRLPDSWAIDIPSSALDRQRVDAVGYKVGLRFTDR